MKTEDMLDLISDVDPESVEEAGNYDIRNNKQEDPCKTGRRIKWIVPLTCVAAAVLAVICILLFQNGRTKVKETEKTENLNTERVEVSPTNTVKADVIKVEAAYPAPVGKELSIQEYRDSDTEREWWYSKRPSINTSSTYISSMSPYYSTIMQKLLTGTDENMVCSPLNTYVAFSMLAEITSGESRDQILKMLNISDMNTLRTNVKCLWESNYDDTPMVKSLLANSIWLDSTIKYNDNTLKTLAEQYYASSFRGTPGSAEFDEALQKWTNENTGNLLSEYTKNMTIGPDTVMELVSTIYFKAEWAKPFSSGETSKAVFYGVKGNTTVDMMHMQTKLDAYITRNFTSINLALTNGGAMHFYLPRPGIDVNTLASDPDVLKATRLSENDESRHRVEAKMSIPKFKISGTQDLREIMKELGVTDIFDYTKADFTPITDEQHETFLDKADHAAMVEIDEHGVIGTAYTAIVAAEESIVNERLEFNLNRPFMFVITGPDGSVLFSGIVRNIE